MRRKHRDYEEAVLAPQTRLMLSRAEAMTADEGQDWLGNYLNKHGLKPIVQGESGTQCDFPAASGKGRPSPCRHASDSRPPVNTAAKS